MNGATVKEAPIDKDHHAALREDDVARSSKTGDRPDVHSKSKTMTVQRATNQQLGLGVLSLRPREASRDCGVNRHVIGHVRYSRLSQSSPVKGPVVLQPSTLTVAESDVQRTTHHVVVQGEGLQVGMNIDLQSAWID